MLGEFGRGKSKHRPRNDERLYTDGKYPFFQTGRVRNSDGSIREYDKLYSDFGLAQSKLWPAGTVCITIAANIAESGILKFDGCFPDSIVGLVPHPEISGLFVEAFIRTAKEDLDRYAPATAQKNINLEILSSVSVPIPPANEQQRIVEKIETLFARLDKGEEAVREVQKLLKRYRQSILKSAVTGELTADWRAERKGELESGADLLARILKTREENWQGRGKYKAPSELNTDDLPGLPEEWTWASVDTVGAVSTGTTPPKSQESRFYGGNIPFLKPTDLDQGFSVSDCREYLTDEGLKKSRVVKAGDVMVTSIGATTGKTGVCRVPVAGFNQQINTISPFKGVISGDLLYWIVVEEGFQQRLWADAAATTLPIINKSKFSRLMVPCPSVEEQEEILTRVEEKMSLAKTLSKACETELKRSAALRQSILKDAFSGNLVPQDPDDEPASALLERIKAARATEPKKTSRKKCA